MKVKPVIQPPHLSAHLPNPHERIKRQDSIAKYEWNCKSVEDRGITVPIRDPQHYYGGIGRGLAQGLCRRIDNAKSYVKPYTNGCGWCNTNSFTRKVVDFSASDYNEQAEKCFGLLDLDPCNTPIHEDKRTVNIWVKPDVADYGNCRSINLASNSAELRAHYNNSSSPKISFDDGPAWDDSQTLSPTQWLAERLKECPPALVNLTANPITTLTPNQITTDAQIADTKLQKNTIHAIAIAGTMAFLMVLGILALSFVGLYNHLKGKKLQEAPRIKLKRLRTIPSVEENARVKLKKTESITSVYEKTV